MGVVPKSYLPNYKEFYEERWFTSGISATIDTIELCGDRVPFGTDLLFESAGVVVGVELCEDQGSIYYPSSYLAARCRYYSKFIGKMNELIGKHSYLLSLVRQQSARCVAGYVYAGFGESSTDLVFAGNGLVVENGSILAESKRFSSTPQISE